MEAWRGPWTCPGSHEVNGGVRLFLELRHSWACLNFSGNRTGHWVPRMPGPALPIPKRPVSPFPGQTSVSVCLNRPLLLTVLPGPLQAPHTPPHTSTHRRAMCLVLATPVKQRRPPPRPGRKDFFGSLLSSASSPKSACALASSLLFY